MTSFIYDNSMVHIGTGEINWTLGQTDFYATLTTAALTKTHAHYSELTNQVANGNGYTTGGAVFPSIVTAVLASNVCQFDGGDVAWTSSTFASAYCATNHGSLAGATNALLSGHDMGGSQSVVSGTLTLQWAATGVFTVTIAAAA
jgi:hypothetical protein